MDSDELIGAREAAEAEVNAEKFADAEARVRTALAGLAEPLTPWKRKVRGQFAVLLAQALIGQERLGEALEVLATEPAGGRTLHLQAHVHRFTGRYDEAEALYRRAIAEAPDGAAPIRELAELLSSRGRFDEAAPLRRRLAEISDSPVNVRGESHDLLARGQVAEGWRSYLRREQRRELEQLAGVRAWNGEDLDGKSILVIREGGVGDEIRDAVCYAELIGRAARTTITCDPRLLSLQSRSFPGARFAPLRREDLLDAGARGLASLMGDEILAEARRHDFSVLSPDLFCFLKPRPEDYGHPTAYLKADPQRIGAWRRRLEALGPGPKIGISWTTIRPHYRIAANYTRLQDWEPVFSRPGLTFVSLQYGDCEDELRRAEAAFGVTIHRWPDLDLKDDFEDVAALISGLDLVMAPNNTVLELAGALATPAWYMVNEYQVPDHWRLKEAATGEERYYPSVRMFMADPSGDAASLLRQVGRALAERF